MQHACVSHTITGKKARDVCDETGSDTDYSNDKDDDASESLQPYKSKHSPFAEKHTMNADAQVVAYSELYEHYRPRGVIRANRWGYIKSKLRVLHAVRVCVACGTHVCCMR